MPDKHTDCDNKALIHQLVKVQAQVTVTPLVKHGKPKVYCIDIPCCNCECNCNCDCDRCYEDYFQIWRPIGRPHNNCTFNFTQALLIEIPIAFEVDTDINQGIQCCGKPEIGPCKPRFSEFGDID